MLNIDGLLSDDGFLAECPAGVVVALSEAAARIAELEKRETHLEEMFHGWRDEAMKASARIKELEEALKPFDERLKVLETVPNAAKYATSTDIDVVHLRAARAKLSGGAVPTGGDQQ